MSTDESTIPFPVNKLKAETLRSMAKDLGVVAGGKKVELLQRLRASSASGWVTPSKRKSDPETFESPPATMKKSRTPRTTINKSSAKVLEPSSPTRRYSKRIQGSVAVDFPSQKTKEEQPCDADDVASGKGDATDEEDTQERTMPGVFDDYLTSGPTSVFITGDDLLKMVDKATSTTLTLWKAPSSLAESDPPANLPSAHPWLIPASEGDKIQNVAAFKEAYKDVLEKLRELNPATFVTQEESEDNGTTALEGPKRLWYEVSVSRNLGNGALAVKLVKGTVKGKRVIPIKGANEEDGAFWLSRPMAAKKDDSELLEQSVKMLSWS